MSLNLSDVELPSCSFCGKRHDEVTKLIAGPYVNVCNECIYKFLETAASRVAGPMGEMHKTEQADPEQTCTFCGKRGDEVACLFISEKEVGKPKPWDLPRPKAKICDECVELCREIVEDAALGEIRLTDAVAERLDRAQEELDAAYRLMNDDYRWRSGVVLTRMALISTVEALAHCDGPLTPLRENRDSLLQQIDECAALAPLESPGYRDLVVNAAFVREIEGEPAAEIYWHAKHSIDQVGKEAIRLLREHLRKANV